MPNAAIVLGSSGGSPATPRIPSVPNNRFAINVLCVSAVALLHTNLHSNLRRVENPHFWFGGVHGEDLRRIFFATTKASICKIEWIGNQLPRSQHVTFRPGDS